MCKLSHFAENDENEQSLYLSYTLKKVYFICIIYVYEPQRNVKVRRLEILLLFIKRYLDVESQGFGI